MTFHNGKDRQDFFLEIIESYLRNMNIEYTIVKENGLRTIRTVHPSLLVWSDEIWFDGPGPFVKIIYPDISDPGFNPEGWIRFLLDGWGFK